MDSPTTRAGFPARHPKLLFGVYCLVLLLLLGFAAEVVLRIKGIKPWEKPTRDVVVNPPGSFFARHPSLGYTSLPGEFTVTLEQAHTFHATNLPNTLRITRPLAQCPSPTRKEQIWLLGCSMTYGWGVNDEDTYAWPWSSPTPGWRQTVDCGTALLQPPIENFR